MQQGLNKKNKKAREHFTWRQYCIADCTEERGGDMVQSAGGGERERTSLCRKLMSWRAN